MKNIVLLGSSGSIGTQTLEVIEKLKDKFNVLALACGKNIDLIKKQIEKFGPKYVCTQDEKDAQELEKLYKNIEFLYERRRLDFRPICR